MAITVKVVCVGNVSDVEIRDRGTIADAANAANVPSNLNATYLGQTVSPEARASHSLNDGDTVVFTAPEAKHG